jgi:hypothetical protein
LRFFDLASPVRRPDGTMVGVLGAHLYTGWIRTVVERTLDSRIEHFPLEVLVADNTGDWLYKTSPDLSATLAALLRESPPTRYLLSSAKVDLPTEAGKLAWTVLVREEASDALAPVYENRRQMGIVVPLLALALSLAFATWLIAGRLARPVERVADAARRHAATTGHALDAHVAGGRDEARLLDLTLQRLALRDSLTGLINRSALKQRLALLQRAQAVTASPAPYAVLLLDLETTSICSTTLAATNTATSCCAPSPSGCARWRAPTLWRAWAATSSPCCPASRAAPTRMSRPTRRPTPSASSRPSPRPSSCRVARIAARSRSASPSSTPPPRSRRWRSPRQSWRCRRPSAWARGAWWSSTTGCRRA